MARRYKPEHFITGDQAIRLFHEAEQFETTGRLPRTAELRMFAKGIYNNDDTDTISLVVKLIYRRLAQRLVSMSEKTNERNNETE